MSHQLQRGVRVLVLSAGAVAAVSTFNKESACLYEPLESGFASLVLSRFQNGAEDLSWMY